MSETTKLNDLQLKYIAARANGQSKGDAVRSAGYGPDVRPAHVEASKSMQRAILTALEVSGITPELLGSKLKEGMDAERSTFITFKGKLVDEIKRPDYENRHKYVKTTLELRGDLAPENQTNVNVGLIEVPRMCKDAESWNAETEQLDAPIKGDVKGQEHAGTQNP